MLKNTSTVSVSISRFCRTYDNPTFKSCPIFGVVFTENIEAIRQFLQDVLHVNLFSAEIYFFTRIPAHIEASEVASVVIMALLLSFLATLYPSWRAARLDPVEGLRYE